MSDESTDTITVVDRLLAAGLSLERAEEHLRGRPGGGQRGAGDGPIPVRASARAAGVGRRVTNHLVVFIQRRRVARRDT